METQFESFEYLDALSRQGSKLSRTSFNTARTDCSIYYECNEFDDRQENKIGLFCDKREDYQNFKKYFKFPETIPRSETKSTFKSEGYGLSNKYDRRNLHERSRSKTTPNKSLVSEFIDNFSPSYGFYIGYHVDEPVYHTNTFSNNSTKKVKFIREEDNTQNSFKITLKESPKPFDITDSQVENNLLNGNSQDNDQNPEKKQETCLEEFCHLENNLSPELFNDRLNNTTPILETKPQSRKYTDQKLLDLNTLTINNISKIAEPISDIEKNRNYNRDKFYIDIPNIFIEGEIGIDRKDSRSGCIFSTFSKFRNICCFE